MNVTAGAQSISNIIGSGPIVLGANATHEIPAGRILIWIYHSDNTNTGLLEVNKNGTWTIVAQNASYTATLALGSKITLTTSRLQASAASIRIKAGTAGATIEYGYLEVK